MLWPQSQWRTLSSVSLVRRRLFYQYFRSLGDCLSNAPPPSLLLPYPQECSYLGLALRQCWEYKKKESKNISFHIHTDLALPSSLNWKRLLLLEIYLCVFNGISVWSFSFYSWEREYILPSSESDPGIGLYHSVC